MSRGPTVKACIKRLQAITLADLKELSIRDLKALVKLSSLMQPINLELTSRSLEAVVDSISELRDTNGVIVQGQGVYGTSLG